jgi:uncharacterized protein (DUF1330 family)
VDVTAVAPGPPLISRSPSRTHRFNPVQPANEPRRNTGMATYALFEIDWHDKGKVKECRERSGPALEKYGSKTLCAGPPQVLDGSRNPPRIVILEFPSADAFRKWYASPEYAPALKLRMDGATTRAAITVEGPTR